MRGIKSYHSALVVLHQQLLSFPLWNLRDFLLIGWQELYAINGMWCIFSICNHIALFIFLLPGLAAPELSCGGNTGCNVHMEMHHKLDLTGHSSENLLCPSSCWLLSLGSCSEGSDTALALHFAKQKPFLSRWECSSVCPELLPHDWHLWYTDPW